MLRTLLLVSVFATGLVSAQDRLTPELLWKLKRVSDPDAHPTRGDVLVTVRENDLAKNKGVSQVVLFDEKGQRRVLTSAGSNWQGRWSPDGKKVAFLSTRAGAPQVFVLDVEAGGDALQVTEHPAGVDGFLWSPKGDRIAFVAAAQVEKILAKDLYADLPLAKAAVYDELFVRHWDTWHDGTYNHLFVVAARGGRAVDLLGDERVDTPLKPFGGIEQVAFTPDGTHLCYTCKRTHDQAASTNSDLWLVPVTGGPSRNLTESNPGYDQDPRFSPDGKLLAYHSMARAGFESDKNRLMVLDRASGIAKDLTEKFDQSAGDFCWTKDGSALVFASETKGTTQLYSVAASGGAPKALTQGRHEIHAPVPLADGKSIGAVLQRTERPFELVSIPLDGGEAKPVSDENGPLYGALALPTVQERWSKATDGKPIHSWVVLPPGFDAKKQYPVLLFCQGGPQSMVGQGFSFRWNFATMASHGYVVLGVNRRGLPGFGQAWNDQISGDWGGQAMSDLLSATDDLLKESWVAKDRVAAIGASFGGYSVYWLMGHNQAPKRFCTMVAHCGVFNLEAMSLATEELFFVDWDLGGRYWENKEVKARYDAFSPNRFLENWDTPLLVIHGEKDFRVPITEGLQAFTAAQRKGIPSRFLHMQEAGHWVMSPQDSVLWYRVFFQWLDRYCKP